MIISFTIVCTVFAIQKPAMQRPYVIGIDIGTGSVKALAVDFNLHAFASSQQFYPPQESPTEQDAEAVFQSFLLCINDLVTKTCHSTSAISLSAAMHSIMAIDKEGNPLTNAMLWSDTRSSEIADGLRKSERGKRIYAATGTPLHSMSPLCKIKWMAQNKTKVFGQAFKFISVKEYIWHKLFNEYKIDYSLASATGLFDILALQWNDEALAFAGINSQQLSEPVATDYKQANMNASFAKKMNISANTPVYIGA
ncbi:MAG TPA: FGGY family carbohydrate kinase, partial [Flavisolibacter sp.]|nr:FGGY family carbohydrate kinase [Flavisolibacter sp.]